MAPNANAPDSEAALDLIALVGEVEEGGNREYTNDRCDFACRISVGSRSIPWTEAALKWSAGDEETNQYPIQAHTYAEKKEWKIDRWKAKDLTNIDRNPTLVTTHVQHSLAIKQPRPHLHQICQSRVEDMCTEIMAGRSVPCRGTLVSCRGGSQSGYSRSSKLGEL